jgi:hypothetical protein
MDVNEDEGYLIQHGDPPTIASKRAPTGAAYVIPERISR